MSIFSVCVVVFSVWFWLKYLIFKLKLNLFFSLEYKSCKIALARAHPLYIWAVFSLIAPEPCSSRSLYSLLRLKIKHSPVDQHGSFFFLHLNVWLQCCLLIWTEVVRTVVFARGGMAFGLWSCKIGGGFFFVTHIIQRMRLASVIVLIEIITLSTSEYQIRWMGW